MEYLDSYDSSEIHEEQTQAASHHNPYQQLLCILLLICLLYTSLLVHLLRYSSEPGISRTQLSVITSWPIKRLASRLRQLETDGVIRSQ